MTEGQAVSESGTNPSLLQDKRLTWWKELPEQFGSHIGTNWLSQDDWQPSGLGGWKLGVIKGREARCEGIT